MFAGATAFTAAAQTQQELNAAQYAKEDAAERAMNAADNKLMAKISPKGQAALREAQRTWLRFRDLECEFETLGTIDGSIHPMMVSACKTRVTASRTRELKAQLDCEEGDLSCGGQ